MITFTSRNESQYGSGQDRVAVKNHGDLYTIVLADGAGGTFGGEEAATHVVSKLSKQIFPQFPVILVDAILDVDSDLMQSSIMGESTAVLVAFDGANYTGVAVGDSEAYSFRSGVLTTLAEHKEVKPVLGATGCFPASFHGELTDGRMLICSDGLWKYMSSASISNSLGQLNLEDAADSLLDSVKLPNGKLQDDVSFVLVENSN